MKDRIIGLGKIIDDKGTVEFVDVDIEQSVIDEIQKAIDENKLKISKETFVIEAIEKLIKNHS